MTQKLENCYRFADLSAYSLKQKSSIYVADLSFYSLIKLVGATMKYETEGTENLEKIGRANKIPIYATWHNRIFPSVYYLKNKGIVVLTSQSFDGEYIARFIQRFGFGAVRGSSTRGGVGALVEMIRLMRKGLPLCFTVDGPKGARYVAKTGALLPAKKTGNPVLPFLVEVKHFRSVNSWDKLQIPLPFSRAKVFFAEPIYVEKNADSSQIETKRLELQTKLDELAAIGKQWREAL